MKENKKVIVFMQVFNSEKYIKQCIDSVLKQTYTNFEFYIVDNASKDKSPQIIQEYVDKDSRIKFLRYEDNIICRWTFFVDDWDDDCYYTHIDHDDWWLPNFLEELVTFSEKSNIDMTVCGSYKFNEEDNKMEVRAAFLKDSLVVKKNNIPQIYWELIQYFKPFWGYIVKVKILKKVKYKAQEFIEQKIFTWIDIAFNMCMIKYCNRLGIVSENLYVYRVHNNNSFKMLTSIQFEGIELLLVEGKKLIKDTNYYNQMVEQRFHRLILIQLEGMFRNIDEHPAKPKEKIKVYMDFCTNKTIVPYLKNIGANAIQFELLQYLYKMIGVVSRHGDEEDKKSLDKFLKKIL